MLPLMLRAAAGNVGGDGIPTGGLIAHYTMDNISGSTLIDEQGSYDGAISGASAVAGHIGNALNFDGSNDYVDVPIALNSAAGAISLWLDGDGIFFSETKTSSSSYVFYCSIDASGIVKLRVKDTGGGVDIQFTSDSALPASGFGHVVIQSDGSNYSVYLNGVGSALTFTKGSDTGAWTDQVDNTNQTYIGKTVLSTTSYLFTGKVDAFRLFDRVLTQDEITALYSEA